MGFFEGYVEYLGPDQGHAVRVGIAGQQVVCDRDSRAAPRADSVLAGQSGGPQVAGERANCSSHASQPRQRPVVGEGRGGEIEVTRAPRVEGKFLYGLQSTRVYVAKDAQVLYGVEHPETTNSHQFGVFR